MQNLLSSRRLEVRIIASFLPHRFSLTDLVIGQEQFVIG
jgi:hypothetical protein